MFNHSNYDFRKIRFMLTALSLFIGALDAHGADFRPIGVVTSAELAVRVEPDSRGLLQKTIEQGTEIKIVERRGGWLKIIHNDAVGFIRGQNSFVKMVPAKKAYP